MPAWAALHAPRLAWVAILLLAAKLICGPNIAAQLTVIMAFPSRRLLSAKARRCADLAAHAPCARKPIHGSKAPGVYQPYLRRQMLKCRQGVAVTANPW
jgi:hypothetical protein